ncbi:methyltransferase domain-containing protein [Bdellovibrionota bacterium FG-1]
MANEKTRYILDSHGETERLERQSQMKAYDFELELQFLKVLEGQKILDAGCGSGIVSDYLSRRAPEVEIVGLDFSKERIEAAKAKYGLAKNISFVQQSLLETDLMQDRFDTILCRYVLRHFSASDCKSVIQNLFGLLKPGGTLYCIDVEGVMGEIYPASRFLKTALRKLREAKSVDFQVARKMPTLLLEQGFQDVDWHVLVSEFKEDELSQEISNLEKTAQSAKSFAEQVLGGSDRVERFEKQYFSALREREGLILFYNRVIAIGTKPKPKLQLVTSNSRGQYSEKKARC